MPQVVHHAIDIAREPAACWALFCDLGRWPEWFAYLKRVDGSVPWRVGDRLTLELGAGPIAVTARAVVQEVTPGARVRWIGRGLGFNADHAFEFRVAHRGLTRVTSHEEFSGALTRLLGARQRDRIDEEGHRMLARFKALAEAEPRA